MLVLGWEARGDLPSLHCKRTRLLLEGLCAQDTWCPEQCCRSSERLPSNMLVCFCPPFVHRPEKEG